MPRPAVLTIDDDVDVLKGVERDLTRRYGDRYRVLSASSGSAALSLLEKLTRRGDPVALFVVDHRMPQMDGVQFLSEAVKLFPDSKRVLLTAYADTDAAIRAINDVKLNHYLLKPWDPPEEHLFPVLDDLLEEWQASYRPPFEGIRVFGTRWASKSYDLREFLARNHVPYRWIDIDTATQDKEAAQILAKLEPDARFPLIVFPDNTKLVDPTHEEIARRVGLRSRPDSGFFDLAIVGGGPAGLAAAVYGASEGLKTVIIEREAPGGQAGLSSRIENYLGFPSGLSGGDLTRRAVAQARRFGAEILTPQQAVGVRSEGTYRSIMLADGSEVSCHALLIATGVQWRKLNVPGIDNLQGAGVYYGAGSTEALSCRNEDVYIIGGANSAGQAAMNFSRFAKRVVLLVRGKSLAATMSKYLIDDIERTPNIDVQTEAQVVAVHGDKRLESISVSCAKTGTVDVLPTSSLFVFIGAEPRTDWLEGLVQRDSKGFVLTGPELMKEGKRPQGWTPDRDPALLETSTPGIFAVGDVRHGSVKRVASSVGEGSIAVQLVHQYLATM
ncbi:MAG: FAD-dependent oxidoreductase [Bryobacteraceae bacterium]